MTIDERIENIATGMEAMKARQDACNEGMERFKGGLEAMKERHDALTMNLELMGHEIREIRIASQQDGDIRALARIAEIHERRITDTEN
jgi:hypothetical protein